MTDLFEQGRAHARREDPQTSHDAARAITPSVGTIRNQVEAYAFGKGERGFIDEQLSTAFDAADKSSYRTRREELTKAGTIVDSGKTKANAGGRQCIVWVHRTFAGLPPLELPPPDKRTKENAEQVVRVLMEAADQMRKEGRIQFSAQLQEAAGLARAWSV